MATLYARVASRGFGGGVIAGQTGAGALESQGGPADPVHGQAVDLAPPQTLRGYEPETAQPPTVLILDGVWGLPGAADTDTTPRTHAAPAPGWVGQDSGPALADLRIEATDIHAFDTGSPQRRREIEVYTEPAVDQWSNLNVGSSNLDPVTGQLRAMGGRDIDQGYARSNGYGFDAGHRARTTLGEPVVNAYLDPAERPFIVPQAAGTFHPTDEVWGPNPVGTFLDAGNINATPPTAYTPPPDPAASAVPPAGGPVSAGWR